MKSKIEGGFKQLGNEGWELTAIKPEIFNGSSEEAIYFFKRKIVPLSKDIELELDKINEVISQIKGEIDRLSEEINRLS